MSIFTEKKFCLFSLAVCIMMHCEKSCCDTVAGSCLYGYPGCSEINQLG